MTVNWELRNPCKDTPTILRFLLDISDVLYDALGICDCVIVILAGTIQIVQKLVDVFFTTINSTQIAMSKTKD